MSINFPWRTGFRRVAAAYDRQLAKKMAGGPRTLTMSLSQSMLVFISLFNVALDGIDNNDLRQN